MTKAKAQEPPAERGGLLAHQRVRELLALCLCGVALYGVLSLATLRVPPIGGNQLVPVDPMHNLGGEFGYLLAHGLNWVFGGAAFLPFLILLAAGVMLFLGRQITLCTLRVLGTVVLTAMLAVALAGTDGLAGGSSITPYGGGGNFGAKLSPRLYSAFGGLGRLLLILFGSLAGLFLITGWMFRDALDRVGGALEAVWRRLLRRPQLAPVTVGAVLLAEPPPARPRARKAAATPPIDDHDEEDDDEDDEAANDEPVLARPSRRAARAEAAAAEAVKPAEPIVVLKPATPPVEPPVEKVAEKPAEPVAVKPPQKPARPKARKPAQPTLPFDAQYPFPPIELFRETPPQGSGSSDEELRQNSEAIVQKLHSFGVGAEVVSAAIGPAVTQYELRLAEGIRVGKLSGFEADLAAALRAVTVRVVAPIPGKDTIGVEVPNQERMMVFLRELIELHGHCEDKAIPLFLGKDVAGAPIVEDLARMPHLLIAGTTGSGKSVCINTILLSILMTRTPAQVRLILVDPKQVELQAYRNVPHLCCDVVTSMKKAPSVLQWAVDEMENRYTMLSAAGVNHIKSYNRLGQQELDKRLGRAVEPDRVRLPYIVLVIDELADLMSVAMNEVEESIQRLAQKSRAVGMHVILATQRPSTDVITGVIKANLPCQIAFKVNRKIDSRVILDSNGAEKLLGHGDMLYVPPGGASMTRAQGTFVSEEEISAVTGFLAAQGQKPNFLPELVQTQTSKRKSMADRDPMYREAVEVILGQQRGSATLLQRAMAVGYTRATRLLEMMEEDGLVGPFVGSKSREVMMTIDEWKAREAAIAEELERLDAEAAAGGEAGVDGSDGPDGDAGPGAEASDGGADEVRAADGAADGLADGAAARD